MSQSEALPTKDVVAKYFTQKTDGVTWKCKCGKERKKGRGWSNLMDHISRQHHDTLEEAKKKSGQISHFFTKKDSNLFGWVDWIVSDLLPFSFCERPAARKYTRLSPIAVETLMSAINLLTVKVEEKIKKLLPDVFAVIFDGWSSGGSHYLSVFATWPDSNLSSGYSRALLAFTNLEDEENLGASSHKTTILEILRFYNKNYSNVACLIGDNCSTNRSIARIAKCFFVGCASHRLNLGVKLLLQSYSDLVTAIHKIMVHLRTIKGRAALRKLSPLAPIVSNVTRWSSVKDMVARYTKLLDVIGGIVPLELQLSPAQNRSVTQMLTTIEDLDVLTKLFQDPSLQLCTVREYLDAAIERFPELEQHCSPSSQIVEDTMFESAVVKIQHAQINGDPISLTNSEKRDVKHLLKPDDLVILEETSSDLVEEESTLSAVFRRIKKRKVSRKHTDAEKYLDLRFIRPTSNICERLFSVAGFTFAKNRQRLLPVNLESQLFLKANDHLWDHVLFHGGMNKHCYNY